MNWKDVFDGDKYSNQTVGSTTIYMVNEFVSRHTNYAYFAFNGTVFPVRAVSQFDNNHVAFYYANGLRTSELK